VRSLRDAGVDDRRDVFEHGLLIQNRIDQVVASSAALPLPSSARRTCDPKAAAISAPCSAGFRPRTRDVVLRQFADRGKERRAERVIEILRGVGTSALR